ncbi:MAG: hypothetical protein WCY60_09715, partial [Trueperaceae bacterium]
MAEKFVVYVFAPHEGEAEAAGNKLAELLKLDPSKVRGLVRRLPDVVTRPVSEREAMVAGRRFQQAGFDAEVRNADTNELFTRLAAGNEPAPAAETGVSWADESTDDAWDVDDESDAQGAGFQAEPPATSPDYDYGFTARSETDEDRAFGRASRVIEPKAAEPAFQVQDDEPTTTWQPPADPTPEPAEPVTAQVDARTDAQPDAGARARGAVEAAAAAAAVADEGTTRRRRGSLRSKLLSTAIIPVLLTIVGALAATWFT